ncbi:MAG: GNAT family N-acetyltransferase [Pirellulales bacterium]
MIHIREAQPADAEAICDIFLASYGDDYPYAQFRDVQQLTRVIYSDEALVLVAEDAESGRVLGTASVLLEIGAYADLVGEFGRLAVHPDARRLGIGKRLMEERLRRVAGRLHVGVAEARVGHPYSLKIAESHDFHVVGYLPQKMLLAQRESLVPLMHHFPGALELRRNHPHVIPEVHAVAHLALENCRLAPDPILDDSSPSYPQGGEFDLEELTAEGYAPLLRIERGRVRHREIFGPLRLNYGFFKLKATRSRYVIAREGGRVAGAVGFTHDPHERTIGVFELIARDDRVIRVLLSELERRAREAEDIDYLAADVSAYAPRMQRTLWELGFLPAAYCPALAFHEVERLDIIKMVRLFVPADPIPDTLSPASRVMAEAVLRPFGRRAVPPRVAQAVGALGLFQGLTNEQAECVASLSRLVAFNPGEILFQEGSPSDKLYVVLSGRIAVLRQDQLVGAVGPGECAGELSLLTGAPHHATTVAQGALETVELLHHDLHELIRQRPDIGVLLCSNLAIDSGRKLLRNSEGGRP